jgi:hypothetical protein
MSDRKNHINIIIPDFLLLTTYKHAQQILTDYTFRITKP